MGKVHHEACPECRKAGRDRTGDNLAVYPDGSMYCFNCGYHRGRKIHSVWAPIKDGNASQTTESGLPRDFTREVPAAGWKWLLQWGLPYSYWRPHCGYSEAYNRLVFPIGEPTRFSIGRLLGSGSEETLREREAASQHLDLGGVRRSGNRGDERSLHHESQAKSSGKPESGETGPLPRDTGGEGNRGSERGKVLSDEFNPLSSDMRLPWLRDRKTVLVPTRKWYVWGDRTGVVPILDTAEASTAKVVLVEDWISTHKVAQVNRCIPLFGTSIGNDVVKVLQGLKTPVVLWLDADQYPLLPKKINRLQSFLEAPVGYIYTEKDPKRYSTEEIKGILNGSH
jgi:hypothetical protein